MKSEEIRASGWASPLGQLASQLDVEVRIERYEFPERRRQSGDWWKNKEHWCVHLDHRHYARMDGAAANNPWVQRTISWSLSLVSQNQVIRWQDVLVEWTVELFRMDREDLFGRLRHVQSLPIGANPTLKLPGYFVCLSVAGNRAKAKGYQDADVRSLVTEVVEALLPQGWIAWTPEMNGESIALLFVSAEDITPQNEDEDESTDADTALDTIYLMMRQLTESLAADAMVSCKAAVGRPVLREQGIYSGIATAIASKRGGEWLSPSESVVGWGTDPVETLLLALPLEGADSFIEVVNHRVETSDPHFVQELHDTLEGLIDANLNVSEAARLLYLHRNTLMNRIEKIRQQTGYDVRSFRDAMTLWLASAVERMTQCP